MKKSLTQALLYCAALLLTVTACKKDETKVVLTPSGAPTLTASTTTPNLALTTANSNSTAVTFTSTAANYGYQAVVTYSLQFDKKGGAFTSPVVYSSTTTAGTTTLTTAQLVKVFTSLGYAYGATSQVDARVVASVGDASSTQTSQIVTITGTPTPLCIANTVGSWGLVGPAGDGWPGATATDRALTYDCYTQTFSLTTTLNAGAFKFRANQDWGTNLGGTGGSFATGVPLTLGGADLSVATAGTYKITLTVTTDATGKVNGGTVTLK